MLEYLWEKDDLTIPIIEKLQQGIELETREYLKPIFKWTKALGKHYNIEKAFAFADWMQMVSIKGDDRIGIKKQSSLQSKYALNTLITMSQRNNNADHAFKAYNMMLKFEIKPDVFTLTALLDVVGRSKLEIYGLTRALSIFNEMLSNKKCLPNVVTFVTMCRIVGGSVNETKKDECIRVIFMLLEEAKRLSSDTNQTLSSENNTLDISLINAALAAIVKIYDVESAIEILKILKNSGLELESSSGLTARILSKLITKVDNDISITNYKLDGSFFKYLEFNNLSSDATLQNVKLLQDHGNYKSFDSEEIVSNFSELKIENIKEKKNENDLNLLRIEDLFTKEFSGCLGPDAPESLRQAVIQHDTQKLLERIRPTLDPNTGLSIIDLDSNKDSNRFLITESDFVTLIHQTRKRKWINQVFFLVDFIRNLAIYGIPEQEISPQIHLRPGKLTYEAAFDAYFSMGRVEESWILYLEIKKDVNNLWLYDAEFIEFLSRGFFQDGKSDYAILIFQDMQLSSIINSPDNLRKIIVGFMHGLGKEPLSGLEIIYDVFKSNIFSLETYQKIICTLIESCALLGNVSGSQIVIENLFNLVKNQSKEHFFLASIFNSMILSMNSDFIIVCLMSAISLGVYENAIILISKWQFEKILPPFFYLHTLVEETFNSSSSTLAANAAALAAKVGEKTLPFRSFLRSGKLRHIHNRRNFVKYINIMIGVSSGDIKKLIFFSDIDKDEEQLMVDNIIDEDNIPNDNLQNNSHWNNLSSIIKFTLLSISNDHYNFENSESILNFKLNEFNYGFPDKYEYLKNGAPRCGFVQSQNIESVVFHYIYCSCIGYLKCDNNDFSERIENPEDDSCRTVSASLLLNALNARLLGVRTKEAKELIQKIIKIGITKTVNILSSQSKISLTLFYCRFISILLKAHRSIQLPGKQISKLLGLLFFEIKNYLNLNSSNVDTKDCEYDLIFESIEKYSPNLEIIRELNKSFNILTNEKGKKSISECLVVLLQNDHEKIVKAIQFISTNEIYFSDNDYRIDFFLVKSLINESLPGWQATIVYLTFLGLKSEGAANCVKRIVRSILEYVGIKHNSANPPFGISKISSNISEVFQDVIEDNKLKYIDLACRLLCKVELSNCIEFEYLFNSIPIISDTEEFDINSNKNYLKLPDGVKVVMVSDLEDVIYAEKVLSSLSKKIIAIDVEWRPFSTGNPSTQCSLLQIACFTHVFLFDLIELEKDWGNYLVISNESIRKDSPEILSNHQKLFKSLLQSLFESKEILKLGFGISGDLKRLIESFPTSLHYNSNKSVHNNFYDLQKSHSQLQSKSLSYCTNSTLHIDLDKRMQRSDWERRPLLPEQINYAALDAYVLLLINNELI